MKKLYEKKDHLIRRNPNLTDEQKSEIIAVLNKYPNLEGNIDWNKSNSLTYEDFKLYILDNAGKSNSQAKKKGVTGLVEGEDYDILSSKKGETLYAVYSHLASKTLASNRVEPKIWTESKVMDWDSEDEFSGRKVYRNEKGDLVELKPGAKWCIAMNNPDYWNQYCFLRGMVFYFLFKEDDSLEDKEKKIAVSVDSMSKEIVTYTFGDDTSTRDFALSEGYKNLIFSNLDECVEKVKQNRIKGLVLNPNTNRYDYKGSIDNIFLEAFDLLKIDESGNRFEFTIDFGEVTGDFDCSDLELISLKGAPQKVGGSFICSRNQLPSLEGAPQEVGRTFSCSYNQLTSLEGAPQKVGGSFNCHNNNLTSLKGAPQTVSWSFDCSDNQLTSLEGAPQKVGNLMNKTGNFDCSRNKLISLEGAPQIVGGAFYCPMNQLTSLKGAPKKVGGEFYCFDNPNLHSLDGIGEVGRYVLNDFENSRSDDF